MCAMVDRDVSHVHKFQSTVNTKTVLLIKIWCEVTRRDRLESVRIFNKVSIVRAMDYLIFYAVLGVKFSLSMYFQFIGGAGFVVS